FAKLLSARAVSAQAGSAHPPRGGAKRPHSKRRTDGWTRLCRLCAESARSRSSRSRGRNAEGPVLGKRRVREHDLARQRRPRLVLGEHVHQLERMRRRRNVGQIELRHLRDRVEDCAELLAEPLELLLGQLQAPEPRHLDNQPSRNRHLTQILTKQLPAVRLRRTAHRRRTKQSSQRTPADASAKREPPSGKRSGRGDKKGPPCGGPGFRFRKGKLRRP